MKTTEMAEIIKTEDLRYAYPAEEGQEPVQVLKGVNLSIQRGEFVAVLGHNARRLLQCDPSAYRRRVLRRHDGHAR